MIIKQIANIKEDIFGPRPTYYRAFDIKPSFCVRCQSPGQVSFPSRSGEPHGTTRAHYSACDAIRSYLPAASATTGRLILSSHVLLS